MLHSEYLRWFLHEEWEIPNQNQLQTSDYRMRLTRMDVIFWETAPCQNRFSVSKRRIILNFALQNHLRPVSLPSKIEIVATPSERPLPTSLSKFTQGNRFWNWFWKTMGEVDLNFKWAISLGKLIFIIKNRKPWHKFHRSLPSRNRFSKDLQASSMLNLSRES